MKFSSATFPFNGLGKPDPSARSASPRLNARSDAKTIPGKSRETYLVFRSTTGSYHCLC